MVASRSCWGWTGGSLAGPPCAIIPLGAQAVPPWAGGVLHRAGQGVWPCATSAVPLLPWPGPSGSRARQGWATGLCPSVGPESILAGHSLPELLLLLWGTAGCHGVGVGCPLAVLAALGWVLWLLAVQPGRTGLCWDHRCPRAVGPVGTGRGRGPRPRLGPRTHVRPVRPFPVRVTGRGVAGGARREEEGGHEPFLPGSLSRDHLGLPGATGCRDTVAVLVPSCVATDTGELVAPRWPKKGTPCPLPLWSDRALVTCVTSESQR